MGFYHTFYYVAPHQKYLKNIAHWWPVFIKNVFGLVGGLNAELQWETGCSFLLLDTLSSEKDLPFLDFYD